MTEPIFQVTFERDNSQPDWFFWITIKVNGVAVGQIARNLNCEDSFSLAIYDASSNDIWKGVRRPGVLHRGAYEYLINAKSAFLNSPLKFYSVLDGKEIDLSEAKGDTIGSNCVVS